VLALLLLGVLATAANADLSVPPPPSRRISDFAGALSDADRARLEERLAERERASRNQVVVAIFRSLEGASVEDYSIRLAQSWRIGQKGLDNGVIFLVFVDDRKMRLEVGYGLESTLTDAVASSILRDVVAPRFREGRLADGLSAGLDAIDRAIAGTYERPAGRAPSDNGVPLVALAVLAGIVMVGLSSAFMAASARRRQGWTGGRQGWDRHPVRGVRRGSTGYWPWFGGGPGGFGGGGFGGGGSSGGGGFSGGGGGFGGGGASESW
jgi:uncharacterized protein